MVNYGADEVSALVLDIGSSSVRAGYAGDDTPKAVFSTSYGHISQNEGEDIAMQGSTEDAASGSVAQTEKKVKLFVGQDGPSMYRHGMEVANPLQAGLIEDFDPISSSISYALVNGLHTSASDHPILVTEPPWNTTENREKMAEIMFEEFQSPAFYIANTGVLNAFAAGKGTALVIDIGQSMASVTPVVDGFVLRKGLAHSALPQLVRAHAKHILNAGTASRLPVELLCHQLIASKKHVETGAVPIFTLRDERVAGVTPSWREWYETREVDEWITSVAGVLDQGWNEQVAASRPARLYEFPTGFNALFGAERFLVGEQYFHHSQQMIASNPNIPKTLPALIMQSLGACDADLRTVLLSNVVLSGGGSLFAGLGERLNSELGRNFAHMKIHSPGNPTERRYGSWLGGSILASLGTFHQLWISKEEWQEHGRPIVGQRCK